MKSNYIFALVCAALLGGITGFTLARHATRHAHAPHAPSSARV